jgi:hypothetical protein
MNGSLEGTPISSTNEKSIGERTEKSMRYSAMYSNLANGSQLIEVSSSKVRSRPPQINAVAICKETACSFRQFHGRGPPERVARH